MPIAYVAPPLTSNSDVVSVDFLGFYSAREIVLPPTLNDIRSAFGDPDAQRKGRWGILDAAGAGTDVYICACDGTNWWYTAMTKAVD